MRSYPVPLKTPKYMLTKSGEESEAQKANESDHSLFPSNTNAPLVLDVSYDWESTFYFLRSLIEYGGPN